MTISASVDDNFKYCPTNYADRDNRSEIIPGGWRETTHDNSGLKEIPRFGSNNYSRMTSLIRDEFKDYFNNEGAVDWQWDIVNRT